MDIWRYVRHPDNSLALAHVYDENVEIVVPILPRPDPEADGLFFKPGAWRWIVRLTLIHFFVLLGCAHLIPLPLIAFSQVALSLGVGMTVNGQYTPVVFFINYIYSWSVLSYAIIFRDLYSLIMSSVYIIVYSIALLFFIN